MNAVSMHNITKKFGNFIACNDITFLVKKNTIHGLVGENGAGKTTLMNILYGLIKPDSGEIYIDEKKVIFNSPNDAINVGIGMVHQHFMLVPTLTVTENIVLGCEPKQGLFLDYKKAKEFVIELSECYNLKIDPDAKIETLPVGLAQKVEILKILYRGAKIIILDEPTAVLTPHEITELFNILNKLKQNQTTIIFISHKLREIKQITDEITVIRSGKIISTCKTSNVTENEIAKMMVGHDISFKIDKPFKNPGQIKISVKEIEAYNNKGSYALSKISFDIHCGEIFGICGVEGNGQSELLEILGGLRKPLSGKILFYDKNSNEIDITYKTPDFLYSHNIAHVPEDRHKLGLQLKYTVSENLVTSLIHNPPFSKFGIINHSAIEKHAIHQIQTFDIRCESPKTIVQNLSGGNQQKIVIAREISKNPEFIIFAHPTRGVDIKAIEFIHQKIIELRNMGIAILLISSELTEILNLSDRIGVIYNGKIIDIVYPNEITEEKLGLLMTGIKK